MQLVAPATSVATTISVDAVGGLPATPYALVLDPSTASEEIVFVTGQSGTTLTVTRAENGTSAVAHSAGASARHMFVAQDATEFQEHMDATEEIHGLGAGSALVGTTTAQVLTGKTINGPDNTVTDLDASTALADGTITDAKLGSDIDADTWDGAVKFVQSATPTHSGASGSAIWFVTT
jgi:hypothetical protein